MSDALYNAEILRLAADSAGYARLNGAHASVEKRSPICGSRVTVDLILGPDGRVVDIGLLVRACALGQAAAAVFAEHAIGRDAAELAAARDALTAWLAGQGTVPVWPRLNVFTPALPYSARHPSIRLAFEAAAAGAAQAARADAA